MLKYLATLQVATIIFFVLKFRFLARTLPDVNTFYVTWGYIFQDVMVWALVSAIFFSKLKKYWVVMIPLIIPFLINILFISKTGYPMSRSLFSQMGDLVMLQTSIDSPSVFRNLFILIGSIVVSALSILAIQKINLSKFKTLIISTSSVVIGIVVFSNFLPTHQPVNRFKGNIFVALASPPETFNNILKGVIPEKENFKKWKSFKPVSESRKKKNIIVIVVETLKANVPKEAMPRLDEIRKQSVSYNQHYTSWPFSSKSLYSLVCALPPIPSKIIEMRLASEVPCQNWIGELVGNHGYRSLISYTGDLHYDNMKNFFKKLGVNETIDRNELSKLNKYRENKLSLDDQSMVDHFEKWLQKSNEPFVSVFITMNSHFPFWDPDNEEKYKEPYLNAMGYQDKIIGKFFNLIKHNNRLEETIFIVTGDHGRRESNDGFLIPPSMYHVPLVVFNGEEIGEVNDPSSHYEIGGEAIRLATGNDFGIQEFNLASKKEVVLYFETNEFLMATIDNRGQKILQQDGSILTSESGWIEKNPNKCENFSNCPEAYQTFHSMIKNLEEIFP